MEMVRKDRGKYVAAAIRMLWAHAAAGFSQPKEMTPVAGFNIWEKKFRALVMWLGMPDPRSSMEEMRAADEELSEANILIGAIYEESKKRRIFVQT
jgi:hypothetical protein